MTSGTCPVCNSSSQPLVCNMARYGYVAFHERCEGALIVKRLADGIAEATRRAPER